MSLISRDLADLATHAIGPHHQYPAGLVLMTGTLFAPTEARDAPGQGFTHQLGDGVTSPMPRPGALANPAGRGDGLPPSTFRTTTRTAHTARRRTATRERE